MTSFGVNRFTGKSLTGWEHTLQSIQDILSTRVATRVMRRRYGGDTMSLVDAPMNQGTVMDLIIATAEALEPRTVEGVKYGEPRFWLRRVYIAEAVQDGRVSIRLEGVYFPDGHRGYFDNSQPKTAEVTI